MFLSCLSGAATPDTPFGAGLLPPESGGHEVRYTTLCRHCQNGGSIDRLNHGIEACEMTVVTKGAALADRTNGI
jgi:hypothetical protein